MSTSPTSLESLCPAQQRAYDWLRHAQTIGNILVLSGGAGMGKTTVLRRLHAETGGAYLTMKELVDALRQVHPSAIEETFEQLLLDALQQNDTVYLDDLDLLTNVVAGCGMTLYPRNQLINAPLTSLAAYAEAAGKHLVVGSEGGAPGPFQSRAFSYGIRELADEDYAALCGAWLGAGANADALDFGKIYRFAPKLNAWQLRSACLWLRDQRPDTDGFIEYLRSQQMASNVDLGEVQDVELSDLQGMDSIIESLEAHIILPLENDALAAELGISPKRGVMLAGPPGTGKTTIGRALARRLRGKFFLIDGTFISGTRDFYPRIHQIFEAAKQNAPAIIFVDDSDVIFESGQEMGLYRYLLTILDGLESESAGRICVMMTAMDIGSLPPALSRSGRIELWLETGLPDASARAAILTKQLEGASASMGAVDVTALAQATEGMTGADLKRLVEDGKILYAYDRSKGRALLPATDYFLRAGEAVRANKAKYAEAEALARQRHPSRPSFFDVMGSMAGMMACEVEE